MKSRRPQKPAKATPAPETDTPEKPERAGFWGDRRQRREPDDGLMRIFGIHAVEAALGNSRREIVRLLLTENARHRLADAISTRGISAEIVNADAIDRIIGPDAVHQGALIEAQPLAAVDVHEFEPGKLGKNPLVVVLDQVTDPHNVGAILRSAAVFGVAGLVMTDRNSPPLGGVVAKAASGGLEHVPVAVVTNLARAIGELKELGYHVIGLDGDAPDTLQKVVTPGPHVLVLGAEEQGLRRLTREACDRLARIEAAGPIRSLNVSNAAAVAFAAFRAKP